LSSSERPLAGQALTENQIRKEFMLPSFDEEEKDLLDLLNQVDRDVVGWLPNPGDKIAGTVVDITMATSRWGAYPLVTLETSSGKLIAIHCFHTVLKNEVGRKIEQDRLNVGDLMAVAYRGEGDAKEGREAANMYRVAIRPAD
jgi:hypothetical protein